MPTCGILSSLVSAANTLFQQGKSKPQDKLTMRKTKDEEESYEYEFFFQSYRLYVCVSEGSPRAARHFSLASVANASDSGDSTSSRNR